MYTPYDGGEVCSNLGLDKSFVEGSVWSGDHQGGEQAESEAFKCVSDTVETPEQTKRLTKETNKQKKAAAIVQTTDETSGSTVRERWSGLTLRAGSSHTACSAWTDLEPEHQGCRSHDPLSAEANKEKSQ